MGPAEHIERFLATGEFDASFPGFEGSPSQRRRRGSAALEDVVRRVVRWRLRKAPLPPVPAPEDPHGEIAARVGPVARGVLPGALAERFLTVLPSRVEIVTPERFLAELPGASLELRWTLANMLLDDMGAPPLSDEAPQLDGFCEGGRAWVTASTFRHATWSDPLVHECAHLLHAADVVGPGTPPVLEVPPYHHELLAYACEIWTCLGRLPGPLQDNLDRFADEQPVSDPSVHLDALLAVLRDAARASEQGPQHAWRVIAAATTR